MKIITSKVKGQRSKVTNRIVGGLSTFDFRLSTAAFRGGQAMLLSVIFFLFISLTIILGITTPIVNHLKLVNISTNSVQSYVLAEALNEDALYRLNHGKNLSTTLTLGLNGATSTATVTTVGGNKVITSQGISNKINRSVSTTFSQGAGVAFNYGVQVGQGGFVLNGGSQINGSVYSNGDIVATNGVTITGTAVAANSSALVADQTNSGTLPPPSGINFRNAAATQDIAQSFQVSSSSPINKIQFYIKKIGAPADATVRIVTDSAGSPGTNNLLSSQGTLTAAQVSTSYAWVTVVFPDNPTLSAGTTYWVVIDNGTQNSTNYYVMGANSAGYANGVSKVGSYAGSWSATTPSGLDSYFTVYLGGITSTIGGDTYVGGVNVGSGGIGDAWAHDVQGASVAGHLYCQTGSNNNKVCDTSRADPSPTGFAISDANIQDWKDEAEAGGTISGNENVNYLGATIGPTKITGNLDVSGGGTLTLTGTVWVQGTITVSGGGRVQMSSSYGSGSGVLLSDGIINLSGGGQLTGSGTSGSYLLVLTTSNSSSAMSVTGGAGAVILNAQNGTLNLSGGVNAKEATANKITATGGTTINYDSGLANINFSSGPSGAWDVSSWQEIP